MVVRLLLAVLIATGATGGGGAAPNFVIIFADDLGYGDLGSYGHPTIATPHLDRMAAEGQRWTSFYVAAPVCTPSRAALLTGRLPIRNGLTSKTVRVFSYRSLGGLPKSEITIAEILKEKGYRTAMVGKWHLGHMPGFLPPHHGFDEYFGVVSSNDHNRTFDNLVSRWPALQPKSEYWDIPLMEGERVVERPADQSTLTKRYAERAVDFIRRNREEPFFLYLAHSMPHTPLFRSKEFEGRSRRGVYGDVIEEIDWSVGRVLDTLREEGLAENTMVLFTSDNGPWLIFDEQGGSAGPLRDGKGGTWEGGMREPAIFWWPGRIKPGVVREMGATLDVLPTIAALVGAEPPSDRAMDGYDLAPALFDGDPSPRKEMFFYRSAELYSVRLGPFKVHFRTQAGYFQPEPELHDPPLVFNLDVDPGENYNLGDKRHEVLGPVGQLVMKHRASIKPVENQLVKLGDGPTGVFKRP